MIPPEARHAAREPRVVRWFGDQLSMARGVPWPRWMRWQEEVNRSFPRIHRTRGLCGPCQTAAKLAAFGRFPLGRSVARRAALNRELLAAGVVRPGPGRLLRL
ncbi:unnamed protein product [Effrenium voratum]|nr:unnamed protein product [Effrenium voratum]